MNAQLEAGETPAVPVSTRVPVSTGSIIPALFAVVGNSIGWPDICCVTLGRILIASKRNGAYAHNIQPLGLGEMFAAGQLKDGKAAVVK